MSKLRLLKITWWCKTDRPSQCKRRLWMSRGIQSGSTCTPVARLNREKPYREADVKRSESKTQLWAVVLPQEATFHAWQWLDRHRRVRLRRHSRPASVENCQHHYIWVKTIGYDKDVGVKCGCRWFPIRMCLLLWLLNAASPPSNNMLSISWYSKGFGQRWWLGS